MYDSLCDILGEQLGKVHKGTLTDAVINRIQLAFLNLRGLSEHLINDPNLVFANLLRNSNLNKLCMPCNLLELRKILSQGSLNTDHPVALFPIGFATKMLNSYSVFLILKGVKCSFGLNGLAVLDGELVNLRRQLLYIIVNEGYGYKARDKAYQITRECGYKIPVLNMSLVPGISMPYTKSADTTYEVSLRTLGINRQRITADSEVEAVERVLQNKWRELYGGKTNRSRKFNVEYWLNTPFWHDIVKESKETFNMQKKAQVESQIQLTPHERSVFDIIKQARQEYNLPIQCRVAGGWVRDKLKGWESDDIDIAISHMSGVEFAKIIERWGHNHPEAEIGQAFRSSDLEKTADPKEKKEVEEENPALEVGGIHIKGQKVEFVPMRTETYKPGSRKPIIARTDDVYEDVFRRDLTINAIYYNIDNNQVEDILAEATKGDKSGIADLEKMFLRTPDETFRTYGEDPLRLLRALRFYSRYPDSTLDPEILQAMADPNIQEAYRIKVSPDRAKKEFIKMLAGHRPAQAVRHLFKTGLYVDALNLPQVLDILSKKKKPGQEEVESDIPEWELHEQRIQMDQQTVNHNLNLMNHTLMVLYNYNRQALAEGLSDERRVARNFGAMLHDFGKMHLKIRKPYTGKESRPDDFTYHGHEKSSEKMSEYILKLMAIRPAPKTEDDEQITSRYLNRAYMTGIIRHHMRPHLHGKQDWGPAAMGRLYRKIAIPGHEYLTDELMQDIWGHGRADELATKPKDKEGRPLTNEMMEKIWETDELDEVLIDPTDPQVAALPAKDQAWQELQDYRQQQQQAGLVTDKKMSPVVDGKMIMKLIPELNQKTSLRKNEKGEMLHWLGEIQEELRQKQEEKPQLTYQEAIALIESWKPRYLENYKTVQAFNLSKIKVAYNPIDNDHDDSTGFHNLEGEHPARTGSEDLVRSQDAIYPFHVGEGVKMRRGRLGMESMFGKVKSITPRKVRVQWDNGEEASYPNDPVALSYRLQKAD